MTTMWLIRCKRSLPLPFPLEAAAAPLTSAARATAEASASRRTPPSRCESFLILSPCRLRPGRGHDIAHQDRGEGVPRGLIHLCSRAVPGCSRLAADEGLQGPRAGGGPARGRDRPVPTEVAGRGGGRRGLPPHPSPRGGRLPR